MEEGKSRSPGFSDKLLVTNSPVRRQGSMRKVLNSSEGSDSMLCVPAKPLERTEPKSHAYHFYHNFFQEYSLLAEFRQLGSHLLPGIYVTPAACSKYLWFGVIFVSSGLYRGGIFRFSIHLSKGFPDSKCPRILFETAVFHPCIDEETMELDLTQEFSEWRKEINHVWQLLAYLNKIFIEIDVNYPVNETAAQMYCHDRECFTERVTKCVELSKETIYDTPSNDDPHYIRFSKYDAKLHDNARQILLSNHKEREDGPAGVKRGHSWLRRGSFSPFSSDQQAASSH